MSGWTSLDEQNVNAPRISFSRTSEPRRKSLTREQRRNRNGALLQFTTEVSRFLSGCGNPLTSKEAYSSRAANAQLRTTYSQFGRDPRRQTQSYTPTKSRYLQMFFTRFYISAPFQRCIVATRIVVKHRWRPWKFGLYSIKLFVKLSARAEASQISRNPVPWCKCLYYLFNKPRKWYVA